LKDNFIEFIFNEKISALVRTMTEKSKEKENKQKQTNKKNNQ